MDEEEEALTIKPLWGLFLGSATFTEVHSLPAGT